MKMKNKSCYTVVLILSGILFLTELTGCKNREAQFLMDGLWEAKAEVDAESSESKISDDAGMKNSDASDSQKDDSSSKKPETDQAESSDSENGTEMITDTERQKEMIYVDVCGAVVNPGVFQMEAGSRVFQAIEAAGGYLPKAAQNCVNRAGVLADGQQLYIPTQEEMEQQGLNPVEMAGVTGSQMTGNTGTGQNTETVSSGQQDNKININTADETQLTTLTGIGTTRAQAIIAYREENGPFASIEDIMNVQGIKEGTFAKIKDEIVVG